MNKPAEKSAPSEPHKSEATKAPRDLETPQEVAEHERQMQEWVKRSLEKMRQRPPLETLD